MSYAQPIGLFGLGAAAESAPVSIEELGQIRTKDGYAYQITPQDVLWLARSVQFEGGDPASTIWTYAQRQAKFRRTSSLTSLVRAHSQPLNPLWDESSDEKCQQYPDRCTAAHLDRRRRARTTAWGDLRPSIRKAVLDWAKADLPNPVPKAVDFADEQVSRSFISRNPGTQVVKKSGNWYLAVPSSLSWPANYVFMQLGSKVSGSARGVGLYLGLAGLGVAGAFAGWAYWKYGRAA